MKRRQVIWGQKQDSLTCAESCEKMIEPSHQRGARRKFSFEASYLLSFRAQWLFSWFWSHQWSLSLSWAIIGEICISSSHPWASLVGLVVKNLPTIKETWDQSLGQEDPLEKGVTTHPSTLAWRILWTEEPGGLQSMGSQSWTWLSD